MQKIEKTIDVSAPRREVYNQWTQFEDFPRFAPGIKGVRQIDATHVQWIARFWHGFDEEWNAEITEQQPDTLISWKSVSGTANLGTVQFEELGPAETRVHLAIAYSPEGIVENAGDLLGLVGVQIEQALRGFKEFIETRGAATGAWRGEVNGSEQRSSADTSGKV